MRTILIDPFIKGYSGHNFNYAMSLKDEFEKRGVPIFIWGNLNVNKKWSEIKNFYPYFSEVKIFDVTYSILNIFRLWKSILLFEKQLNDRIFNNSEFNLEEGDIFHFHTPYVFELLAIGRLLKRNKEIFSNMYKFISSLFFNQSNNQTVFFSDGELLKQEYEKLLKKRLTLFPVPIYPFSIELNEKDIKNEKKNLYKDKITISYAGAARHNKGFDLFAEMINGLINENNKEVLEKIFFIAQINTQKQPKSDMKITLESICLLKNLSKKVSNIKIIHEALPLNEYYKLLFQSDIIVLPHRYEGFKSCCSYIFRELMILGKVPVSSSNTAMAYDLQKYGLDDLIFEQENYNDLIKVIKSVVSNYEVYRKKIASIAEEWKKYYSSENLVNVMVNK
jgi:glycosyltransferase involved in cell wall biosynthesis